MMSTHRKRLIAEVSRALGPRHVFWFGTRGDDARSLSDLPQFSGSFTILNRYTRQPLPAALAYEDLTGVRVDLDDWDIDNHLFDEPTLDFRRAMLRAMSAPHAIIPYRPCNFLSALEFSRKDKTLSLGMFAGQQRTFEHKPWVETALTRRGIPTLNWHYIADEDQLDAGSLLADGPIVVRPSRGSGGSGMSQVATAEQLDEKWPEGEEFFASVSAYLPDCLPLNVGAVVWDDGVTIHPLSIQLIGIPSCVDRPFGHCGNDFALPKALDSDILTQVDTITRGAAEWLREQGYRGAFGIDFMLDNGRLLVTEINPRFQGSTRTSCMLSVSLDLPCLLLDHIAAMLHLSAPDDRPSIHDLVSGIEPVTNLVIHNTAGRSVDTDLQPLSLAIREIAPQRRMEVMLAKGTACDPGAIVTCVALPQGVTQTGYSIDQRLEEAIKLNSPAKMCCGDETQGLDEE